jgi:hypothetical protein
MKKTLTAKPGMPLLAFLVLGIVVFQSSFTPAHDSKGPVAHIFSDTSFSLHVPSYFSISKKLYLYDSLGLKEAGLSKKVFAMALKGMAKLVKTHHIKDNLLAIIDFSQPSINKRLYVVDLDNYRLLYNTWVAHGIRTGKKTAESFSNKPSSCKSSLGFYITGSAYNGSNGYSLKLQGMEKGINDAAMRRGIVIHGADYVNEELINSQGYIGRSWGCPAVSPEISQSLIDDLKDGACLFIYAPNRIYNSRSALIR